MFADIAFDKLRGAWLSDRIKRRTGQFRGGTPGG
jgi:hypothetical protein